MHVVHVCRSGWPVIGGLETAVHGLARAQAQAGHEVRVVTLAPGPPIHEGVRYARVGRVGPRRYPFASGLRERLAGADLVHVHGVDGLADQAVRAARVPVGISTHGGYFHTPRHRILKALCVRTLTRATFGRASAVWFTSRADQASFRAAGRRGEIVPNGIDVQVFAAVRRRPEVGRLLMVGRLVAHKGHADLLRALARLPGSWHLDVVGDEGEPGMRGQLRHLAAALDLADRVRFWGALGPERLRDRLAVAELALFPSRAEGFGIAVVESMAAGVPVVVSPIPAFDELVVPGRTGYRLDFTDPARAARALGGWLGADHARICAHAAEAVQAYSWSRVWPTFERAYRAVM